MRCMRLHGRPHRPLGNLPQTHIVLPKIYSNSLFQCLLSLTYSTVDLIYPSLLDSKLSIYASTRFRCDIILCLAFTIASTALRRAMQEEGRYEDVYWERDASLDEMRRISSLLAGFAR